MQIPVIQKPAINSRSRDSGARVLNVQANPNAFMAEGEALSQAGKRGQQQAQNWAQIAVKISANKENTAAQGALKSEIEKARLAVQAYDDPVKAEAEFKRMVAPQLRRMTSNGYKTADGSVLSFSTGTSRRAFDSAASALMTAELATVRQVARQRQASSAVADTLGAVDEAVKDIATMREGPDRDVQISLRVNYPLEQLEEIGHFTAEQRFKETRRHVQRISRLQVEQLMTGLENPEQARDLFDKINKGEIGKDLSATARQDLSERALSLEGRLERQANQVYDRNKKINKEIRETRQKNNYHSMRQRVRVDEGSEQTTPLTVQEVDAAYADNGIDEKMHKLLLTAISNKGEPQANNKGKARIFMSELRNADGRTAIKEVLDSVFNSADLDTQTIERLNNFGLSQIARTPEVKREKLFRKMLDTMAKPNSILEKMLPGSSQHAEAILSMYDAEVLDGEKPLDAFQKAVDSLSANRKANLKSVPKPRFALEKKLELYTQEDVATVRERTIKGLKGKASTLALELIYLETLERYVEDMTPEQRKEQQKEIDKLTKEAEKANE
jgi:hypothetical protein